MPVTPQHNVSHFKIYLEKVQLVINEQLKYQVLQFHLKPLIFSTYYILMIASLKILTAGDYVNQWFTKGVPWHTTVL
jgi:hypothetical protein